METANTKGRRLTVRKDGVPCYDIVYRSSFEDLGQELAAAGDAFLGGRSSGRAAILADWNCGWALENCSGPVHFGHW